MKADGLELNKFYMKISESDPESEQREHIISIPTKALGMLRKELTDTMGKARTKGFLLRYGWHSGVSDATKVDKLIWTNSQELLLSGPKMHILHGWMKEIEVLVSEVDFVKKKMNMEAIWYDSYEAFEYIKLFGFSDQTVCHTMTGYASGYLSTILKKKVIVQEIKCKAKGDDYCQTICRTVEEWGSQIDHELSYYTEQNLIQELDQTYEQLKHERDILNKSYSVHEKFMKQVLDENGIPGIAQMLFEATNLPSIIEDQSGNIISFSGISKAEAEGKKYRQKKELRKTGLQTLGQEQKLMAPIFFQKKITGYCSLIFEGQSPTELDKMILERAALSCSTIMLNERTKFLTEQRVRGSLMNDILSGQLHPKEAATRAYYLGFEFQFNYFIVTIEHNPTSLSIQEELKHNEEFMNELHLYFRSREKSILFGQKAGKTTIILSEDATLESIEQKKRMLNDLIQYCKPKFQNYQLNIGISSTSLSLQEAPQLYSESLAALNVAIQTKNVVHFDSLGMEGLFFQLDEGKSMQKFINKSIGKLLEKDKTTELTKTLYHYLNNSCNVHKTARNINFSISGLRYRLQRIEEILDVDINQPVVSYQLFTALQSLILLGRLSIDID